MGPLKILPQIFFAAGYKMNPKLFHVQTAAGVIPVRLEVATTEESRGRGLMERFFLPDRYGMLFV